MPKMSRDTASLSIPRYWSQSVDQVVAALGASRTGLDQALVAERLQRYGRNTLATNHQRSNVLKQFLERFRNPLVLILIFAPELTKRICFRRFGI
jgi:magnesium-transporting ATPase (P-type)